MGNKNIISGISKFLDDKDTEFVSLDLGTKYIKCLEIKDKKICNVFVEDSRKPTVKSAIELLKKRGLTSKKIKLTLKGPDTIIRYVNFPKLDKAKLKESFGFELSKHIPFPQQDVYYDIFVLDENYSQKEFLVLLAVAKKELIDSLLEEFTKEKISIADISLNAISLINLYYHTHHPDSNVAILDMGFSSTILSLLKKDKPYLSREIRIAGKALIKKIAAASGMANEEIDRNLLNPTQQKELLAVGEEVITDLCDEVKNSFDYLEMNTGEQIQTIYLTGGLAAINGVKDTIDAILGIETKIWQPWNKLNTGKESYFPKEMLSAVAGLNL
ncbi:MAG: pilus assembly protein PilM [Candidatus Omnitrophica bacterium]|nr:pilus assembly protein PilM [Candidatus Omnitrophota bacterium]